MLTNLAYFVELVGCGLVDFVATLASIEAVEVVVEAGQNC